MEHFYRSAIFEENWFDFENLYTNMVNEFPTGSVFVEVGSWKGRSAAYMCVEIANSEKSIDFYCIDRWLPIGDEYHHRGADLYKMFLDNLYPVRQYFKPIQADSVSAAARFDDESVDFVFIDADHTYASVKADILAWYPKVKKGGIIAGHDYYSDGSNFDVYTVVNELFPNSHEILKTTTKNLSNAYCFIKRKM